MLQWLFGKSKEEDPPKRKPTQEQEAEDKWKYDFLVQFLSGPVWKVSILDFVDYHCVVFDNEEQNKFEYTTIHKKFKELVATLFDGMMQEVGLDEQKLAELLDKGFASKHKKIFNQLLLADDFLRFKQLMVSRNKTLEAEAIKALAESTTDPKKGNRINQEQLLRESQALEEERRRKFQLEEEEQLRKVLEMSKIEAEEQSMIKTLEETASKVQEVQPVQHPAKVQKAPEVAQKIQKPADKPEEEKAYLPNVRARNKKTAPVEPLPPLRQPKRQEPVQVQQKPQTPVVVEQKVEQPVQKTEVESQQDRRKRLLEQRERIRRKKEEERRQQATEEEGHQPVQTIVLQQDGIHQTHIEEPKKQKVSQDEIDRRRELMKKIKNRIVDDF